MNNTQDRYDSMSWKEFEDFVIALLARIYASDNLNVVKTPYQNDGGKDGYGSLSIGPTKEACGHDLSIVMRLWAEVKKRSSSNVDIGDIGGHIILAIENPDKVNTIIFITNRQFTERAEKLCKQIGNRLGLAVKFIDGGQLHKLESSYTTNASLPSSSNDEPGIQSQASESKPHQATELTIRYGFTSSALGVLDDFDVDMHVDSGEIFYWACDVEGSSRGVPIVIEAKKPNMPDLRCVFLTPNKVQIDDIDTQLRIAAAVWSDRNICLSSTFMQPQINSQERSNKENISYGKGALHVRTSILSPMIPESRQKIINAAKEEYSDITKNGGTSCLLIEAVAGVGKSFLLQRIRHEYLGSCGFEIYLDGAVDVGIERVVQSILQQTFPLPSELVTTVPEDVIKIWLARAGHAETPSTQALSFSEVFASGSLPGREQEVLELVASSLINASVRAPVVMTFEDLHKTTPGVYDFLQRLLGILASRRRGRVFIVLTTRPRKENLTRTNQGDMLQDFGSSRARIQFHRIESFSKPEAHALLEQSLRGLTKTEADMIVSQVGTSPFALREALQYLRTDGTIDISPDGLFFLANPDGIRNAAKSGYLLTATKERISWLSIQIGDWFNQFIRAGACLGKQFSIADAISVTDKSDDGDLRRVIDLCFDYNVLSPIRRGGNHEGVDIAFDHDLVRNSVLLDAGEKKVRFISGQLLSTLTDVPVSRRKMLLEYLADDAEACLKTTSTLLRNAKERKSHNEAVQFAFIKATILIATGGIESKTDFLQPYLERFDDALTIIPAPELATRPSSGMMIEGMRDALLEMEQVGMLESEVAARLITIAQIHAGYKEDNIARSDFCYFDGRRLFGMNQYQKAYAAFLEAERIWPNGIESRAPELSRVRIRQAICERHLGDLNAARSTMKRALQFRLHQGSADWRLFQDVVANLGAFYMYENQKQAARCWSKGLRVARLEGNVDKVAHFLNDLGHLCLMERKYDESQSFIRQAEAVIEKHGLYKEQLRSNILSACIFLSLGRLKAAHHALSLAEDIALSHGDLRRLWRVRANLATWAELRGHPADAVIYDLQALTHMPIQTEYDGTGTIGGRGNRVTGALMNIVHRFKLMPKQYTAVKDKIDEQIWESMIALFATLTAQPDTVTFAGGIGCLYQPVGDGCASRFLITE